MRRRAEQDRARATRTALCQATLQVLRHSGYAGLSERRVAEAAGVSRGALTHHFPTKAALVTAAMQYGMEEMIRGLSAATVADEGAGAALPRAVAHLWRHLRGGPAATWIALVVAARTDPELRGALPALTERFNAAIDAAMAELLPEAPDEHRATAGMLLFATLNGLALDESVEINASRIDAVLEVLPEVLPVAARQ